MKGILAKFLELLEDSVITQSILVLLVFGTIVYCIISATPIPDVLNQYGMVIIGFFFGAKTTRQVMKGLGK